MISPVPLNRKLNVGSWWDSVRRVLVVVLHANIHPCAHTCTCIHTGVCTYMHDYMHKNVQEKWVERNPATVPRLRFTFRCDRVLCTCICMHRMLVYRRIMCNDAFLGHLKTYLSAMELEALLSSYLEGALNHFFNEWINEWK